MDFINRKKRGWRDEKIKQLTICMQSTKHEIEMIQCNRQTTHLGTNTVVKHGFIFSV